MVFGFTQVNDIDDKKTFAQSIRYNTLRVIFTVAVNNNRKVHQLDIVTMFFAGKLDKVTYLWVFYFF